MSLSYLRQALGKYFFYVSFHTIKLILFFFHLKLFFFQQLYFQSLDPNTSTFNSPTNNIPTPLSQYSVFFALVSRELSKQGGFWLHDIFLQLCRCMWHIRCHTYGHIFILLLFFFCCVWVSHLGLFMACTVSFKTREPWLPSFTYCCCIF